MNNSIWQCDFCALNSKIKCKCGDRERSEVVSQPARQGNGGAGCNVASVSKAFKGEFFRFSRILFYFAFSLLHIHFCATFLLSCELMSFKCERATKKLRQLTLSKELTNTKNSVSVCACKVKLSCISLN